MLEFGCYSRATRGGVRDGDLGAVRSEYSSRLQPFLESYAFPGAFNFVKSQRSKSPTPHSPFVRWRRSQGSAPVNSKLAAEPLQGIHCQIFAQSCRWFHALAQSPSHRILKLFE